MSQRQMRQVWECADWQKVIAVFGLTTDQKRRSKPHELWIKSPFTTEENASLHLDLKRNIYKDFSGGTGARKGILNFCQDLLSQQGKLFNCYEVAQWMVEKGISYSKPGKQYNQIQTKERDEKEKKNVAVTSKKNKPIHIDLRPFMQTNHPELKRRGLSVTTCHYLGCGYLPIPHTGIKQSPLQGRIVFQIRGISENQNKPVILTHSGRALAKVQEEMNGKYWSFPFHKSIEMYNQDNLINDVVARNQIKRFGLILVEGFFDVAALVEAGCFNVAALMGAQMSLSQLDRLKFIHSKINIPKILIFLDRDKAGVEGVKKTYSILYENGFRTKIFDWEQVLTHSLDLTDKKIPNSIMDAGDMSVVQIQWLKKYRII
jgi:DNA primase